MQGLYSRPPLRTPLWNSLRFNQYLHSFIISSKGRKKGRSAEKDLECAVSEGHKKTYFDFQPSEEYRHGDTSIGGKHNAVKNRMYWMASCFGIGTPCSSECEGIFNLCF